MHSLFALCFALWSQPFRWQWTNFIQQKWKMYLSFQKRQIHLRKKEHQQQTTVNSMRWQPNGFKEKKIIKSKENRKLIWMRFQTRKPKNRFFMFCIWFRWIFFSMFSHRYESHQIEEADWFGMRWCMVKRYKSYDGQRFQNTEF